MSCDINADLHLDAGLWSLIPGVCHMTFPILGHGPTVHFGMSNGVILVQFTFGQPFQSGIWV